MVRMAVLLASFLPGASVLGAPFPVSQDFAIRLEQVGPGDVLVVGSWTVDGVQGWSWGVCHHPLKVKIGDCMGRESPADPCAWSACPQIQCPRDIRTALAGGPPSFHAVNVYADGIVQGVLLDFSCLHTLGPTDRFELLKITYTARHHLAPLRFCDTLGRPPMPVAFAYTSKGFVPAIQQGCILVTQTLVPFTRGDPNGDGDVDVGDAAAIFAFLTKSAPEVVCLDAADVNDDGKIDLADALTLTHLLHGAEPSLPEPYVTCGIDPTHDALGCESHVACKKDEADEPE